MIVISITKLFSTFISRIIKWVTQKGLEDDKGNSKGTIQLVILDTSSKILLISILTLSQENLLQLLHNFSDVITNNHIITNHILLDFDHNFCMVMTHFTQPANHDQTN